MRMQAEAELEGIYEHMRRRRMSSPTDEAGKGM